MTKEVIGDLSEAALDTPFEQEDAIQEREDELDTLVYEFIAGVLDYTAHYEGFDADFDAMVEDCKEHFLAYIARRFGIDIYRPMVLEDENGVEFFEEYPYPHMEFDDNDNPVYIQ